MITKAMKDRLEMLALLNKSKGNLSIYDILPPDNDVHHAVLEGGNDGEVVFRWRRSAGLVWMEYNSHTVVGHPWFFRVEKARRLWNDLTRQGWTRRFS